MNVHDLFYHALGVKKQTELKAVAKKLDIPINDLKYYNENNILPSTSHLRKIELYLKISPVEIMLKMGIYNADLRKAIAESANLISQQSNRVQTKQGKKLAPKFESDFGKLYRGDCIVLMKQLEDDSIDLIFADPPFNLNKMYLSEMDDDLSALHYIEWTEEWLDECVRILKPGGSLYLWNLPKWNSYFSSYLNNRLFFKHWIATDIKYSLPIKGRLYPSHYSLLYYTKGERANYFNPDRLPMETCPKCLTDLKDYGGYKDKMNPKGVNISDIWTDIPPVRHNKYKKRKEANELSVKLLDRIIEMSSQPGDVVFDPFGGSGTTYVVAEVKKRKWVGVELGPVDGIIERFETIKADADLIDSYRKNYNTLFTDKVKKRRMQLGLWTDESFTYNK